MASIHKRARSPYWQCQYRAADGSWGKVSTKLEDKKKAEAWCTALQDAEDLISRGSPSEAQLRAIIDRTMVKITGRDIKMPTVREWFDQWLAGKDGANVENTLKKYRQSVSDFLEFLGQRADGRLESVTQADVIAFRSQLRTQGRSPSTVNLTIAKIIGAPFRSAFNQGLIAMNPAAGFDPLQDKGKKRKKAFTVEQVRLLLAAAGEGEWEGAILAGYTTGMRLGDVVNLMEEMFDYENDVIAFHQGKTQDADDDATVIGLHPDFKAWLIKRKVRPMAGPVFPTLAGRQSSGRSGLSMEFGRFMEKAGIESVNIREKTGLGRTVRALTFHSFRHGRLRRVQGQVDRAGAEIRHRPLARADGEDLYPCRY